MGNWQKWADEVDRRLGRPVSGDPAPPAATSSPPPGAVVESPGVFVLDSLGDLPPSSGVPGDFGPSPLRTFCREWSTRRRLAAIGRLWQERYTHLPCFRGLGGFVVGAFSADRFVAPPGGLVWYDTEGTTTPAGRKRIDALIALAGDPPVAPATEPDDVRPCHVVGEVPVAD